MHDLIGERAQAGPVLDGYTHQFGDHVHRKLAGELRDVIKTLGLQSGVEVLFSQFDHPGFEFADPAGGEALRHQGAQAQMSGVIHRQKRHGAIGLGVSRDRIQRDPEFVRQFDAIAKSPVYVRMTSESPEVQLVIAVQRCLIAKPPVVGIGILMEVVVIGVQDQPNGVGGHASAPGVRIRPTTYASRSAICRYVNAPLPACTRAPK